MAVTHLGAQGDGVATAPDGNVIHIPFAAPGDDVRVRLVQSSAAGHKGQIEEVAKKGARQVPFCQHFGTCGGCRVQHVPDQDYVSWKTGLLRQALARRGLGDVPVGPLVPTPKAARRRASFGVQQTARGAVLGFRELAGQRIISLNACPLLVEPINDLLPPLNKQMSHVMAAGESAEVLVTQLDAGVDILITGGGDPGLAAREAWARFADQHDLVRISWRSDLSDVRVAETLISRKAARLNFDGLDVSPPPGVFLQPSQVGESVLRDRVQGWVPKGAKTLELFCGVGTFTAAIARSAKSVHAIDVDDAAIQALNTGVGRSGLAGRIGAETRNLFDQPVMADALKAYDCVVLDPPRAGAYAQTQQLALSQVPIVIMVSCNPQTFSRDARCLVDGGYEVIDISPVDQFLYSHHLECVGWFKKPKG